MSESRSEESLVFRFQGLRALALIGGGDQMLSTALDARALGLEVAAILSPRHAVEPMSLDGRPTLDAFKANGFETRVFENINQEQGLDAASWTGPNAASLCFGPAWVFSKQVRGLFSLGMYNINQIPVPRYLGGAHYTWQILNADREGGCVLQHITGDLDRGAILERATFTLPKSARRPIDYMKAYHEYGETFVARVLRKMAAGAVFKAEAYAALEPQRLYLPRLLTIENAWIDWSWQAGEIERFCAAFDAPYKGAASHLGDQEVRLRDVFLSPEDPALDCHPFLAGLVVRRHAGQIWLAARGGLLRVETARLADGSNAMPLLREGARLTTSANRLGRALSYLPRFDGKGVKPVS